MENYMPEENNNLELDKELLKDTQDARDMQKKALSQEDKFSKRFVYYLAAGSVFISFCYLFAVTFFSVPPSNQRIVDTVVGVLIGAVLVNIYQYFYGSSMGSRDKQDMIKKLTDKKDGVNNAGK